MSEDISEQAQYLAADEALGSIANGSLLGPAINHMTPGEMAQHRAYAQAHQEKMEAQYREREANERAAVQARLDRETRQAAVHAALMIEGERATADDVLRNAERFAAFLRG